jgi:DNA-binding SARP family transcriptional activator
VPRQSLSLLESLIRCGPRGTEDSSLMDRLWPDAEGDTAAGALATAVFRLKRLLDTDESIVRSGGRTRLNSAVCWVDVWH